jgi:hypothetical protein
MWAVVTFEEVLKVSKYTWASAPPSREGFKFDNPTMNPINPAQRSLRGTPFLFKR